MLLLAEVPAVMAGATVVTAVVVVLAAEVALVVVCLVAVVSRWWSWWRRLMWQQLRLLRWIHGNIFHKVVIIIVFGLYGCPAFCLWE
jgi:hypothetical protein